MTNKKSTKRSLIMSGLALFICISMFIGSTYAWFTDSVTSSGNKIKAGTLDIQLLMDADVDGTYDDISDSTSPIFGESSIAQNNNAATLWEPGKTQVAYLAIKNNGQLALKYTVGLDVQNVSKDLYEVMEYAIVPDADANHKVTSWTSGNSVEVGTQSVSGDVSLPVGATHYFALVIHMDEEAGNEYQDGEVNFDLTVLSNQDTVEKDSFGSTYDEYATYGAGATIIGLNGTYDSLTAAAKAWRESKGIATSGGNMGGHPADLTSVDSISWVISGSVGTGDGTGVVGTSGSLLSGGYIYPSVAINNVYIKGVNNAELKNELGSDSALTAGGKNVVYDGITFPEYVSFNSGAENVTFKNCTFKGGLKVMQAINVTVYNCKFEGDRTKDYAFFAQAVPANSMKAVQFNNNTVSDFMRGINVQAGNNAVVTINGNNITNIIGKTGVITYGSAIQLTSAKTFTVTHNTISDVDVNAFHIYNGCAADSIVISDNNISAAYLCWNEANYTNVTSSGNTLNSTNSSKCVTKTAEVASNFALN